MSTTQSVNCSNLCRIHPHISGKFIRVDVQTEQTNVTIQTGLASHRIDFTGFSDKFETDELIIKIKTDKLQKHLERIVLLSKLSVPVKVSVNMRDYTPPEDDKVNLKYIRAVLEENKENTLGRLHALLTENPREFPMIPFHQIAGAPFLKYSHSNMVDLRDRVEYKMKTSNL